MKGYINDGICYIFPQEVVQIPEVEANFYYVQQEDYAGWVAANESIADKIVKYNFNILSAKAKPFAGHTDDNLEPAQPQPTLYDVVYGGDYSSIITNTNISSAAEGQVLVFEAQSGIDLYNDYVIRVDDISSAPIPVDAPTADNNTLTFTMPDKNAYITITVKEQEPTLYSLTLAGTYSDGGPISVTINDETPAEQESPYTVPEGATVKFANTQGTGDVYEWDPQLSVDGDGNYYIVMPAEDVTITINYTGGGGES